MQQTRQQILEILRDKGEATVHEIVDNLEGRIQHGITAVTIRHHLDVLRSDDLVTPPTVRHRNGRGRPQYVYQLTEKAQSYFPSNYQRLAANLLLQIKATLPPKEINVIMENVATQMVENFPPVAAGIPMDIRLDQIVDYLNQQGYDARWEGCTEGYILHTCNCPYHDIAGTHDELCGIDLRLIAGLVGVIPRVLGRIAQESESCAYLIPAAPSPNGQ